MPIRCECQQCDAQFQVDSKYAGRKARCPKCKEVITVPGDSAPPVRSASAAPPRRGDSNIHGGDSSGGFPPLSDKPPALSSPAAPLPKSAAPAGVGGITTAASSPTARLAGRKKSGPPVALLAGIGGGVAILLVVGAVAAIALSGGSSNKGSGKGKGSSGASSGPELVLDWPANERSQGSVTIDGKKKTLPTSGTVRFPLSKGDHKLLLQRRGYEPIEVVLSIDAGTRNYKPQWKENSFAIGGTAFPVGMPAGTMPLGYNKPWTQDFNEAAREAAKNGKDIFLAFVSSDSQHSKALQEEIFYAPQFQQLSQKSFELVVIDFPRTADGRGRITDDAQNQYLLDRYGVTDLPTLVMTDAEGKPYASDEGYLPGQARQYISQLSNFAKQREERDRFLSGAEQGTQQQRLENAAKAVEWIAEHDFELNYENHISQWHQLARQADPQNQQGKLEVFFEADWLIRLQKAGEDDAARLPAIVADLDQWAQGKRFADADRAVRVYWIAARLLLQLDLAEQAGKYVTAGLTYEPSQREAKEALEEFASYLAHEGELSTGTGFVIAPGGYMFTNHHVIEGEGSIVVVLPGNNRVPAKLIADDPQRDMAIIQVQAPHGDKLVPLPVLSEDLGRGAEVAAFGYPLGDQHGADLKLTRGVIGGLPNPSNDEMLLLDCRVNPGNSGGPLINSSAQVIGMVTAKSRAGVGEDSYGFALPTVDLIAFLKKHLPGGYEPVSERLPSPLPWSQVDQKVSPSVFMIVKLEE